MLQKLVSDFFDIRKGEFRISLFMFLYIFGVIAVLLIIKPTVNALFLSELGPEQLPFGFLLVSAAAVLTSLAYSRWMGRYGLRQTITSTLVISAVILALLATLLLLGQLKGWMLYAFYTWVAIYAVLSASQFWVLANLIFSLRDAKRLFGFIGSGGILGGIFGGYLASVLAPLIGNEFLLLVAMALVLCLIPLLGRIWKARGAHSEAIAPAGNPRTAESNPLRLIRRSAHLTNLAILVGVSVLVAKLIDYLFSEYATQAISDPDELTAFFGFWFSSFNLISLGIQLVLTHRIVGIWGVGISLLLLPFGILAGSVFFLFVPELAAVVAIKAMDGSLKQSINKSAFELLALPLPFDLKKRTKSFIDVVVDSVATGLAGLLLIFIVKGLDLDARVITWIIIILALMWTYGITRVRSTYYQTFRAHLRQADETTRADQGMQRAPALEVMRRVLTTGTEKQILFMLAKVMEVNDKRLAPEVRDLLEHPATEVKAAALRNLYFLDAHSMPAGIGPLLKENDPELTAAVMDFLLLHARKDPLPVLTPYLESEVDLLSESALFSLARECRGNRRLRALFGLDERLASRLASGPPTPLLLKTIARAGAPVFYSHIQEALKSDDVELRAAAIQASGISHAARFIEPLLQLLGNKAARKDAMEALNAYGPDLMPLLVNKVQERSIPVEWCRNVPRVIGTFETQRAADFLFALFEDTDLSVRLEAVRELSRLRGQRPELRFSRLKVAARILEECRLYHQTLSAMHTQIIISYRNRKKARHEVLEEEREARAALLELLERRLDSGLERIFRLLGLKYPQEDIHLAYERFTGTEYAERAIAIDFLDNLLTGSLKQRLLPILEEAVTDFTSEEAISRIRANVPSETECFELLLRIPDLKLNLAVLYLIRKMENPAYMELLRGLLEHPEPKVRSFAGQALDGLSAITSPGPDGR